MLTVCLAIVIALTCIAYVKKARQLRQVHLQMADLQAQYHALRKSRDLLISHAYFDHLTGLANRTLLDDRFKLAVERAKRNQIPFALVMIDLNNFKHINDGLGHLAGDEILVKVSKRLVETVRASDTVARFGGDEFVLIVESIAKGMEFGNIGTKLIDVLGESVKLDSGAVVSIGASVGFAVYPTDGVTLTEMLDVADKAMYSCKSSGMMPLF